MRIVFLTQDDPLYILPFFDEFFRQELEEIEVLGIFSCKTMGDRGRMKLLRELHCLYGAGGLARLVFRVLGSKTTGMMPARKSAPQFHSVAQICRAFGIPTRSWVIQTAMIAEAGSQVSSLISLYLLPALTF